MAGKIKVVILCCMFLIEGIGILSAESMIRFNGSGAVDFSNAKLNINSGNSTGITIEMLMKFDTASTEWTFLSGCGITINSYYDSVYGPLHHSPSADFYGTGISQRQFLGMFAGSWINLTIQMEAATGIARIFFNGVQVMVKEGVTMPSSVSSALSVGNFTGWIDELRVSNIPRYTSAFAPQTTPFTTDANTIGLWHFDDGSGTSAADSSGNNITGSLSGSASFVTPGYYSSVTPRPYVPSPPVERSPFGVTVLLWGTRNYPGTCIPYDDGINDGMTNSKIFKLIPEMGAKWVRDYGFSHTILPGWDQAGGYYWPEDYGYDWMDQYKTTLDYFKVNSLHTCMGFGGGGGGYLATDLPKYFNLQKEIALRYKDTIKYYKFGHEWDNHDTCRWCDTCRNYTRNLKYAHDAVKAADPSLTMAIGDLARSVGGLGSWNNGEFFYTDGMLNFVEELALDKVLNEITTNGNLSIYDTTSLGGFPASKNPRDFMDGALGLTCYGSGPGPNFDWIQNHIDYNISVLAKYGMEKDLDLQIHETAILGGTPTENANALIPTWRFITRSLATKQFFFIFDGICSFVGSCNQEGPNPMIQWDANSDCVPEANVTKNYHWYAHKKMTHLSARLEEFYNDDFKETGGTNFWNTGWVMSNFNTWSVTNSTWEAPGTEFAGTTGSNPYMTFKNLCLPTWAWKKWAKPNWVNYGLNRYFTVRMKANSNSTATLYWDNKSILLDGASFTDTTCSQSFAVTGDGAYHIYKIDLSANTKWDGAVAAVRFDPTEVSGDTIALDYLGFVNDSSGPTALNASASPNTLKSDGISTSIITATVVDALGTPVTTSTALVRFTLSGAAGGTLVGTNPVNASGGVASITYRAGTSAGTATITATSSGLTQSAASVTLYSNRAPNAPVSPTCNGQTDPAGLTVFSPDLRWVFSDPDTGDSQTAFRVFVATSTALLNANNGNTWNTGKRASIDNFATYTGTNTLKAGVTYYWKVMTWDEDDASGAYCANAKFSMAQASQTPNSPPNIPGNLRCAGLVNPTEVTDLTPDLSWSFSDPDAGNTQSAYRILVANSRSFIDADNGNMWNSGKSTSSASTAVYNGQPLSNGTTYYWKVSVWDNFNSASPYSQVATFKTHAEETGAILWVSTTALDFGMVEMDAKVTRAFEIRNLGVMWVMGNFETDQNWITIDPPGNFVVPVSSTFTVTVDNSILSESAGSYDGNILIHTNVGDVNISISLVATCVLAKPNPYNPRLSGQANLTFFGDGIVPDQTIIKIFTLSGELVKILNPSVSPFMKGRQSGIGNEIEWNGLSESGQTISSGIYIYTYDSPKEKGIGKFTVIQK